MILVHVAIYLFFAFMVSAFAYVGGQGIHFGTANVLTASAAVSLCSGIVGRFTSKYEVTFMGLVGITGSVLTFAGAYIGIKGHLGFGLAMAFLSFVSFTVGYSLVFLEPVLEARRNRKM